MCIRDSFNIRKSAEEHLGKENTKERKQNPIEDPQQPVSYTHLNAQKTMYLKMYAQ